MVSPEPGIPGPADRIQLRGLRVLGKHGVLAEEQSRCQPFEVDLDLALDLRRAGLSDDLVDTVDYGTLACRVAEVVSHGHFALLEALAQAILDVALSDERVIEAIVCIRKLRPPLPLDLASVGVSVSRARARAPSSLADDRAYPHLRWSSAIVGSGSEVSAVRRRAFLGLGSNLGDRPRLLADAVAAMPDVVATSPIYETEPVGGPPGQGPFLNAVVELFTEAGPRDLLELARTLEQSAARVRSERWGPRTLDVDVLLVGDLRVDEPDLVVPHPRLAERAFVLVPLADLAPLVVERLAGAGWRSRMVGEMRRFGEVRRVDGCT